MPSEILDTHSKALALNLDATIFGSFAEIGAGQETARWFLRVGAASGTVAKTICAYDKAVSDDLYGSGSRYVSKPRLEAMLETEWSQLELHLSERSGQTRTFAFANTVSARNYAGTNHCHGWLGIEFRNEHGASANTILLHVNLLDPTNLSQQESLGILGVNLIYACYHQLQSPESFLAALSENLGLAHVEIDFIETSGALFSAWDRKQLTASLVTHGLAAAVVLPGSGEYLPLSEVFYKTPVVLEPGQFEEQEPIHTGMLNAAVKQLQPSSGSGRPPHAIFCLWTGELDTATLIDRAAPLLSQNYDVLLTTHRDLYRISHHLRDFTSESIRFAVGLSVLVRMINESYDDLHGHILESLGRLFTEDVRVYVHPMSEPVLRARIPAEFLNGWTIPTGTKWIEANQVSPPPPLGHLYQYLLSANLLEPLQLSVAEPSLAVT